MTRSERWRPVVGFEGQYEVSDLGRVKSVARRVRLFTRWGKESTRAVPERILRPGRMSESGHVSVALGRDGGSHCVHTLVAKAFLGPRPSPKHEVRHLNGRANVNRLSNLEWGTRSQNGQDKKWHDGQSTYRLSPSDVQTIKQYLRDPPRGEQRRLAALYGVAETTISSIKHGRFHRDV